MGSFSVHGLDELCTAYEKARTVPEGVTKSILMAMAEKTKDFQSRMAASMFNGLFVTGTTAGSIKIGTPKVNAAGGSVKVTFSGSRTRGKTNTRNAEIAYINEFGKKGQPARPFIRTANEQNADAINEAGEKIFNDWLDKTGL